jgi:TolA-binding protein
MDSQQTHAQQTNADRFLAFLAWVEVNKKRLITYGIIVLVAVVAMVAFVNYQAQKEQRASEALSSVRAPSNPATPLPPGTAEAYLKVAKEHAGTKAAARALELAARTRFEEGNYADAQKLFEQFTREYGSSPWLANASYGIAAALEAQGKTAEALAKYEEVRRRFGSDPTVSDETKLAIARIYEQQNKSADALKVYEEMAGGVAYSGFASEAQARREELLEKHPELKTNLPAPPLAANPITTATNRTYVFTSQPPAQTVVTNRVTVTNMPATPTPAATNIVITPTPQPSATNK